MLLTGSDCSISLFTVFDRHRDGSASISVVPISLTPGWQESGHVQHNPKKSPGKLQNCPTVYSGRYGVAFNIMPKKSPSKLQNSPTA